MMQQPMMPPAAAQGGSGFKILMVLLVCFAVAAVAAIGGLYYIGHKVKQAVVKKAEAYGVTLPSMPSRSSAPARPRPRNTCDLLSQQEVSRILGEPIERTESQPDSCNYWGPAGLGAKLAQQQASDTFQRAQAPGAKVDGAEVTNSVDQLINNLGAGAPGATGSGEMPLLMLTVQNDGGPQMAAITATGAIFNPIFKSAGAKGASMTAEITGLGDKAIRLPKLGLNVLKGDVIIRIIAGPVPEADAKTIEIARTVLPKV